MKACSACGRPFAPAVDLHGPVRQRIYDYVAAHPEGVTRAQIMASVYADDPNGGPEWDNVVAVHVKLINRLLAEQKQLVRVKGRGGPGSTYRVVAYP